jgi:hypothetical protein
MSHSNSFAEVGKLLSGKKRKREEKERLEREIHAINSKIPTEHLKQLLQSNPSFGEKLMNFLLGSDEHNEMKEMIQRELLERLPPSPPLTYEEMKRNLHELVNSNRNTNHKPKFVTDIVHEYIPPNNQKGGSIKRKKLKHSSKRKTKKYSK